MYPGLQDALIDPLFNSDDPATEIYTMMHALLPENPFLYDNSGIFFDKWNIEHRMTIRDMPKLGTTIVDKEGLKLVQQYLASLKAIEILFIVLRIYLK